MSILKNSLIVLVVGLAVLGAGTLGVMEGRMADRQLAFEEGASQALHEMEGLLDSKTGKLVQSCVMSINARERLSIDMDYNQAKNVGSAETQRCVAHFTQV